MPGRPRTACPAPRAGLRLGRLPRHRAPPSLGRAAVPLAHDGTTGRGQEANPEQHHVTDRTVMAAMGSRNRAGAGVRSAPTTSSVLPAAGRPVTAASALAPHWPFPPQLGYSSGPGPDRVQGPADDARAPRSYLRDGCSGLPATIHNAPRRRSRTRARAARSVGHRSASPTRSCGRSRTGSSRRTGEAAAPNATSLVRHRPARLKRPVPHADPAVRRTQKPASWAKTDTMGQ